jgi:hypothetical protein
MQYPPHPKPTGTITCENLEAHKYLVGKPEGNNALFGNATIDGGLILQ